MLLRSDLSQDLPRATALIDENAVLCRHLAAAQLRQQQQWQLCRQLEAELLHTRAELALRTTELAQARAEAAADLVICQTGCTGQRCLLVALLGRRALQPAQGVTAEPD